MDKENKETVVLGMISRGHSKFDKISQESKIEPRELELILQKLEKSGLIRVDEKKGWLGTKIDIKPTEDGYREFERQLKILKDKWNNLENTYKTGNKQELEQKLKEDKSFLPSMMMFGIIDIMMFSMMFSMIGATMGSFIPAEDMQGMDEDSGDMDGSDMGDDGGFDIDIGF
jgi:DNA-binding HxlR family transcriptional regulator|tara:strand:- start:595 stop:1110 length:516 start_codon:yes stop_codon:yes gene_type:complete